MDFSMAGSRRLALGLALSGTALLASCGGGTQVDEFVPTRLIAFGDEASAYEPLADSDPNAHNRRKYTVRSFSTCWSSSTPSTRWADRSPSGSTPMRPSAR